MTPYKSIAEGNVKQRPATQSSGQVLGGASDVMWDWRAAAGESCRYQLLTRLAKTSTVKSLAREAGRQTKSIRGHTTYWSMIFSRNAKSPGDRDAHDPQDNRETKVLGDRWAWGGRGKESSWDVAGSPNMEIRGEGRHGEGEAPRSSRRHTPRAVTLGMPRLG